MILLRFEGLPLLSCARHARASGNHSAGPRIHRLIGCPTEGIPVLCWKAPLALLSLGMAFVVAIPTLAQKEPSPMEKILDAKAVYFDNQTGSDPVGHAALGELRKWGRFQIVSNRRQADLIFLLSTDPYKDGNVLSADDNGQVNKEPAPSF